MHHTLVKGLIFSSLIFLCTACIPQNPPVLPTESQPTPANVETQLQNGTKQVAFTTETKAQEYASVGPTVYFFRASWCPTCNIAQKDLDMNLSKLPEGTTIVIVDYDKETSLKQKYAITYQHTFVQIDKDGSEIAKWNGGGVEEITANIKQ